MTPRYKKISTSLPFRVVFALTIPPQIHREGCNVKHNNKSNNENSVSFLSISTSLPAVGGVNSAYRTTMTYDAKGIDDNGNDNDKDVVS